MFDGENHLDIIALNYLGIASRGSLLFFFSIVSRIQTDTWIKHIFLLFESIFLCLYVSELIVGGRL